MTSTNMGRRYIEEALGRTDPVRLAHERGRWSTVVREAQEAVELLLLLKGALRLVAVEPARTHDPAELLRREAARFPDWMRHEIDHLAAISTEMAGDRGLAFYGDERQALGPQELFDESDGSRAVGNLEYVAKLVTRLLAEHGSTPPPSAPSSDVNAD
ncbi:MAG TPA: HEPN domain-containing protein [Vicinamibacterales bacterium]|nr:HEPN domain-containing protein [Vicinamibacterales bacterium]